MTHLEAEAGKASLEAGHVTGFDRLCGGRGWGAILLFEEVFVIVRCHGGWWWWCSIVVSSQCGRDVEGSEDKDATSNLSYIVEIEGQDKEKKSRLSF